MFKVIQGGRSDYPAEEARVDQTWQILAEGQRRLQAAGLERYEARERITGVPTPRELRNFKLQLEFAIEALSRLSPVPADITSDRYWPLLDERVTLTG